MRWGKLGMGLMLSALGATTSQAQTAAPLLNPASIDQVLSRITREERSAQAEIASLTERQGQVRLRTIARGRAYVRLARAGLMPAGAGIDELVEHASRVEGLRRSLERDLELAKHLSQRKLALMEQVSRLKARRLPLVDQQRAMAGNQALLAAEEDRRLAFERAFSQSSGSNHAAVYGAGIGASDLTQTVQGFAALSGRMPFPLVGRTEIRTARRRAASGPGLEMLATSGTPVRSVFPGTVAFADEYADYGITIIVDHGDGYYTVSANLGTIDVRVGDDVGASDRIGTVGNTGGGPLLYFEIRHGNDTLNPADWFGL